MSLFLHIFIKIIEFFNILNFIYIRTKIIEQQNQTRRKRAISCTQPSIIVFMDFIPTKSSLVVL